jgi:hypothetical protein
MESFRVDDICIWIYLRQQDLELDVCTDNTENWISLRRQYLGYTIAKAGTWKFHPEGRRSDEFGDSALLGRAAVR